MSNPIYPWDEWFRRAKKRDLRISRGKDYECQPHSMGVQVRNAAKARGLYVSIRIEEYDITISVNRRRKRG